MSIEKSWPIVVANSLGPTTSVFVSAINGETSRDLLYRLDKNVLSLSPPPDLLYVQYGINDANYWATSNGFPRVSLEGFVANIEEVVLRSLAAGITNVVLGTNHRVSKKLPEVAQSFAGVGDLEDSVPHYNQALREIASRIEHCQLLDVETLLTARSHLLPDGVHLNEDGHRVYADAFLQLI